ncbi:histidine phosphatase family protein [Phenylobacterium sp. LjRoot219]|uniref:histidine phosphatase family protein n=1 Tax=Phenylobacterium sp. LjRoot219 TaxID=3342283 RepID=UPI003ECE8333
MVEPMIYLVRHGETEFNRERRLQGHVDSPLTDLGRRQVEAVGAQLKALIGAERGWRILASPLGRTRRTAEILAERIGLTQIEVEPRLIELSWGDWDGRLRADLAAACPTFGRSNWAFHAPTGETYPAMCARLAGWLAELPPEAERRIIAVSHGVTGRVLRGVYAGLPIETVMTHDAPQDAVFQLADGEIRKIACALAA